jgi:glutaredoxin|tara:strand:- start:623 stop:859 length:237 start_codon:yes stop_codon:yes gene_type:complete
MNFTVFSKDGCPFCTQVTEVLRLAKLNYVEYKLGKQFDRKGFYGEFGEGSTFPQVVLNGQKLGGCSETVRYLKENNMV